MNKYFSKDLTKNDLQFKEVHCPSEPWRQNHTDFPNKTLIQTTFYAGID